MSTNATDPVRVTVDAGDWLGELSHAWTYIGYDECNYTYTPEGQELLSKFGAFQEQPYYVRCHHLLCTGNAHGFYKWGSTNAYREDDDGQPHYDWTIVDRILDTILRHGGKPFVEVGFMPQDLADPRLYDKATDGGRMEQYQRYGWACPPKDYQRWHDLVFEMVQHCVERYGVAEVNTWYWELWNEPDLDYYWKGSIDEFCKLYDYTVAAVKAACPTARVGGPGTTNPGHGKRSGEYLDRFLAHCASGTNHVTGERGTALDFTTFHAKGGGYRADPWHCPQQPPSVRRVLEAVQVGHEILSRYDGMAELECVLSEVDPDGWAAGGAWDNANLNFRNTAYYPSFVAAAFHKLGEFAAENNWDLKLLSWAFIFVGERCFEGTRAFSTQGIDKAILNLFRMYARMGRRLVRLTSDGAHDPRAYADAWGSDAPADVSGFATLDGDRSLQVLLYCHHDTGHAGAGDQPVDREIQLEIAHLPFDAEGLVLRHYRIDHAHSNAYTEWVRQGRPMYPAPGQRASIAARQGLELLAPPEPVMQHEGRIKLSFTMPVHAVSLLELGPA